MLILINGITGNMGLALTQAALSRGHQVRGLARNPSSLPPSLLPQLESLIPAATWYDTAAHDRAMSGVDVFINATAALTELMLDGQLLLLRAAERAGVKRFVPATWNYDFTRIELGYHESYDPLICFKRQMELSSALKGVYVLTGALAEFWFQAPFSSRYTEFGRNMMWDPRVSGTAGYFGDGGLRHQFTTFADAAAWTVEIATGEEGERGGVFSVMSLAADVWEMRGAWERVMGKEVRLRKVGEMEDLRDLALGGREKGTPNNYYEYIRPLYAWHTAEGKWLIDEDKLYEHPNVKRTGLEEFLEANKQHFKDWPTEPAQDA